MEANPQHSSDSDWQVRAVQLLEDRAALIARIAELGQQVLGRAQLADDRAALIELIQSFLRYEITRDQLRTQAKRIAHRKDPENNA